VNLKAKFSLWWVQSFSVAPANMREFLETFTFQEASFSGYPGLVVERMEHQSQVSFLLVLTPPFIL